MTSKNIEIRPGQAADFEQVYALIKRFAVFQKTPDQVYITLEQMIEDQEIFKCLVATEDKRVIGFATYFFSYHSWSGKAIYLDDLYVLDDYRGEGVGSMLFDKVIDLGKQANCFKMKWQVSSWNHDAQEFYKQRGAVIDDVEVSCDLRLK